MIMYTELNYFINIIWKIDKSKYIIVKNSIDMSVNWLSLLEYIEFPL